MGLNSVLRLTYITLIRVIEPRAEPSLFIPLKISNEINFLASVICPGVM